MVSVASDSPDSKQPLVVLVTGPGRSGTTLLRDMLGSHPDLHAVTTEWTPYNRGQELAKLARVHGPRSIDDLRRLAGAMSGHHQFGQWNLTAEEIEPYLSAVPVSREGLFLALVQALTEKIKPRCLVLKWVCSEHLYPRIKELLEGAGMRTRFLYIVRQPLDAYSSWKHRGGRWRLRTGQAEPVRWCATWLQTTGRALEVQGQLGAQFHLLRYEDLVSSPLGVARELCEFLRIDDHADTMVRLEGVRSNTSFPGSTPAAGGVRDLTSRSRPPLSSGELAILAGACRSRAQAFGYELPEASTPPGYLAQDIGAASIGPARYFVCASILLKRRLARSVKESVGRLLTRLRGGHWED